MNNPNEPEKPGVENADQDAQSLVARLLSGQELNPNLKQKLLTLLGAPQVQQGAVNITQISSQTGTDAMQQLPQGPYEITDINFFKRKFFQEIEAYRKKLKDETKSTPEVRLACSSNNVVFRHIGGAGARELGIFVQDPDYPNLFHVVHSYGDMKAGTEEALRHVEGNGADKSIREALSSRVIYVQDPNLFRRTVVQRELVINTQKTVRFAGDETVFLEDAIKKYGIRPAFSKLEEEAVGSQEEANQEAKLREELEKAKEELKEKERSLSEIIATLKGIKTTAEKLPTGMFGGGKETRDKLVKELNDLIKKYPPSSPSSPANGGT